MSECSEPTARVPLVGQIETSQPPSASYACYTTSTFVLACCLGRGVELCLGRCVCDSVCESVCAYTLLLSVYVSSGITDM